ncbi:sigma-70 family RNA polymerase sigma factor [Geomesophilobacter sediminis]|uniref:Sigma-70 family RNA polymerase sigma factor n=1 Tax=Geomesophilobacter sediminis TaxID=2798584 RepID=A0A8J7M330_9BACT|nr:sigma-70 family RNA polymerase sigma factor [Geomesophilobacter sediminis]MBJ6727768.1 sigma-70 family RNA polymerase sigma factor [Geomesophilobacter sediminis]
MEDFAAVYREFQPKIQRYLTNLVGEADAPDLAQVVFLKVSRSLDGFREEASLSTWIYRIATNAALDHRRALRHQGAEELLDEEAVADLPDAGAERSDQRLIREEMSDCVRAMVDRLPDAYRTVLLLSEFEELSNPEIAGVLDLSLDVVKIRLHRARTRLREAMRVQCTFYRDERSALMCDRK